MEPLNIFLHRFDPNPWNPRMGEDPEHIKKLALSIRRESLLQIPLGRWIFPDGKPARGMGTADLTESGLRVQLAFGHSRLAAFRLLESERLDGGYSVMPVYIQELSDEAMFCKALEENLPRKDLDPIEVARAMARYRTDFSKTSVEIGELFGLSDSAVRNKMRLLGLPESLQDALRKGELSEGSGRALIGLYDLPEAARLEAEDGDELKPSEIIEAARSGLSPARVAEMITALARRINPHAEQIPLAAAVPMLEPAAEADEPAPASTVSGPRQGAEAAETEDDETEGYDPAGEMTEEPEEPVQASVSGPRQGADTLAGASAAETPAAQMVVEYIAGTDTQIVTRSEPAPAPAPAPTPARPAPAPIPAAPSARPQPAAQAVPKPEPKAQPAPAPVEEPKPALTWEQSTILLSLTLWPEDSHGGRMVSIGGRVNQGSPTMAMASLAAMELPWQLSDLLEKLRKLTDGEAK